MYHIRMLYVIIASVWGICAKHHPSRRRTRLVPSLPECLCVGCYRWACTSMLLSPVLRDELVSPASGMVQPSKPSKFQGLAVFKTSWKALKSKRLMMDVSHLQHLIHFPDMAREFLKLCSAKIQGYYLHIVECLLQEALGKSEIKLRSYRFFFSFSISILNILPGLY